MSTAYLSIGTNIARRHNLARCLQLLDERFAALACSRVLRSRAVGFDGRDFFNMAASIESDLPPGLLNRQLKALEAELGRDRSQSGFSDRVIDVDLLLYDGWQGRFGGVRLPRPEILQHAFVLQPLAELAPGAMHPEKGQTLCSLWRGMADKGELPEAAFEWPRSLGPTRAPSVAPRQGL